MLEFPIDPTETAIGVMMQPRAPRGVRLDPEVLPPALGRGDRRQPPPGHHRPGAGAQPRDGRLHRPGVRREPDGRPPCPGMPAYTTRRGHPRRGGRGDRRGAGRGRAGRRARLRRQGRARPDRHLLGLRRDRRGGPPAPAPAGRPVPLLRAAADRAQLPRRHQHRPGGLAERLAVVGDAAARPGRVLLPVRRARLGDPGEGAEPRARPLDVRQRRQPCRRLGQRPAAVLGGGRLHRGRAALPRVDRQPAQVLPDRAPGLAAQADHRGALRPHHPGRADGARGAQDRRAAAGRGRDVPPGRRDPGRHPRRDVRRRPAARPPAAAARAPGRGRRQLRRARACSPRTPPPPSASWSTSPSRWAPRPPPRTSRTPSTAPSTTPRSTRWWPSTSRRSTSPARTSPTCWPPSASSPTSRWSRRSSARRACPSCCGCPTSPARRPGAARCRRTPPWRPPCGPSRASWSTPCGCAPRTARRRAPTRSTTRPPRGSCTGCWPSTPTGSTSTSRTSPSCSPPTASRWRRPARSAPRRRRWPPARRWAGTSCSRRPPTTCASGPTWRTCGATSTTPTRWPTPGTR